MDSQETARRSQINIDIMYHNCLNATSLPKEEEQRGYGDENRREALLSPLSKFQ
jgi:hypothetical protein